MCRLVRAGLVVALLGAGIAHAEEPAGAQPASADPPRNGPIRPSLLGGHTPDAGETVLAAALGWPELSVQLDTGVAPGVGLGLRVGALVGSPMMGLVAGAGGGLAVPMRVRLFEEGRAALALRLTPGVSGGEARLFGESAPDATSRGLGLGARLDAGLALGLTLSEGTAFSLWTTAGGGVSWTEGDRAHGVGSFAFGLGLETWVSADTMLFAQLEGGAGIREERASPAYYPQQEFVRLALGLGHAL